MLNFKENNANNIKQFLLTKEYVKWVNTKWAKMLENEQEAFYEENADWTKTWFPFTIENAYRFWWIKVKNAKWFLLHVDENNLTDNYAFLWLSSQLSKFENSISKEKWVKEFIQSCDDEYILPQFISEFEKSVKDKEDGISLLPIRIIAAYLQLVRKEVEDDNNIIKKDNSENLLWVLHSMSSKKEKHNKVIIKQSRQKQAISFIDIYNKNNKLFWEEFFENVLTQIIAVDLIKVKWDIKEFLKINKDFKNKDLKLVKKIFKDAIDFQKKLNKKWIDLRMNQVLSVLKFLKSKKIYIDASDMWAWKSRTAIASILSNWWKRNIIICKKWEQEEKWLQEFNKISKETKDHMNPRLLTHINQILEEWTFILKHSNKRMIEQIIELQKQWLEIDLIVYDEPHNYFSNINSKTYKAYSWINTKKTMWLTWTPVKNKWSSFASMYSILSWNPVDSKREMVDNFWFILKDFYENTFFIWERDIWIHLPKLSFFNHVIDDKEFDRKQEKIVEEYSKASSLTLMQNLVKFSVEPKFFFKDYKWKSKSKYLAELLNKIKDKWKTVVFQAIAFKDVNPFVQEELIKMWIKFYFVNSKMTDKERNDNLYKWRNDKENSVLIASINSFWEWIELYEATNIVFLQQPFNYSDKKQAIKRVHRLWQEKSVEVHTLIMNKSIDVSFYKLLNLKKSLDLLLREWIISNETLDKSLIYKKEALMHEIWNNEFKAWIHLTWIENEDYEWPDKLREHTFIDMNTDDKHNIRDWLIDWLKDWDKILELFWNWEFVDKIIEKNKKWADLKITSIDFCLKNWNPWQLIEDEEQEKVLNSYNWKYWVTTKKIDLENFLLETEEKFDMVWLDYMWLVNNDKLNELWILLNKWIAKDWWTLAFTFYWNRQKSNFTWMSYLYSVIWTLKEYAFRKWYVLDLKKELEYQSTWNSNMIFLAFNIKKDD